jgi:hypothetical protein
MVMAVNNLILTLVGLPMAELYELQIQMTRAGGNEAGEGGSNAAGSA